MPDRSADITKLLQAGNRESLEALLPLVYDELKGLANALFRRQPAGHTLQPTALVHEAFLKLVGDKNVSWQNRAHFFGIAARAMKQILINHAVAHSRRKRGGGQTLIALDESISFSPARDLDVLALHEALEALAALDPRSASIVELRFFGGLGVEETAEVMKISTATVNREWKAAKTWLYRRLNSDSAL
jgi:RNA polymerase sigma-70 factor, ECF subfamily